MGADYTPQLSSVILGKILSCNQEGSQYTLKILRKYILQNNVTPNYNENLIIKLKNL